MTAQNKLDREIFTSTKNKTENKRKGLKIEALGIIINILTISVCAFTLFEAMTFKVPPEIIAVTNNGSFFEKTPLDQSNKSEPEMKQWITNRIIEAFDYDFTTQSEHVMKITQHYSPEAAASLDSFINGGNSNGKYTESMLKRRVTKEGGVVKILLADGITLSEGKVLNLAGWQGTTKGSLVLYTKSGIIRLGRYSISMVVVRADENENQDGLKIKFFQMEKIS